MLVIFSMLCLLHSSPKQFTVRGSQFFLKMCPPFLSVLVSALFRWPCGPGSEQVVASMPPKVIMERSLKLAMASCVPSEGLVGNHYGRLQWASWVSMEHKWTSTAL